MRAVLVTTENRGVFFGYMTEDTAPEKLTLTRARNCVFWDVSRKGFLGLASDGPGPQCKIGPEVPSLTLYKITSVSECTPEAIAAWDAAPWG